MDQSGGKTPSIEGYDHLIGMGDIEVLAKQFPNQIRIRVSRIEQCDTIPQLIPLCLEPRNLVMPLVEHGQVLAPGKHTARPRESQAAQDDEACKCRASRKPFASETMMGILNFHGIERITVNLSIQALFKPKRKLGNQHRQDGGLDQSYNARS